MVSSTADAIAEVEARGRLVHDDDARLLRQRAGDQDELALAAGDAGRSPLCASAAMPRLVELRAMRRASSAGRGAPNEPRCAVRPITTRSSTV